MASYDTFKHTCPIIDRSIADVRDMIDNFIDNNFDSDDVDSNDLELLLDNISDEFEVLRSVNEEMRSFYERQLNVLANEIAELECENRSLQDEVYELDYELRHHVCE